MTTNAIRLPDDRELVAGFLREHKEKAFRELYRRHTPRIYLLVRRLLGGAESDVADVVQETWVRAAERLQAFEWRSEFSTWLIGIAINCSRELIRRRARRRESALLSLSPDQNCRNHELYLDLERAIVKLPDGYREVLVLHDIEGFTHQEISRRLGIDPGTSKSQLHHARRKVREQMSVKEEEEVKDERQE